MQVDFEQLKIVDSNTKHLVFGYFRRGCHLLPKKNNIYLSLPTLIVYTCVSYYYIKYKWCSKSFHRNRHFSINKKYVVSTKTDHKTIFLDNLMVKGIHEYKFRIIQMRTTNEDDIGIGIISTTAKGDKQLKNLKFYIYDGYCYIASNAQKIAYEGLKFCNFGEKYGVKCNEGDIIKMTVDLEENVLKYVVNKDDYGIAFDIKPKTSFKAAVYLYADGTTIELL